MVRLFRRIFALTTGIVLLGSTMGSALAATTYTNGGSPYDLSLYPAPFVKNGVFEGKIVVGENADVPDVIGAIEIAANLQATSTTKTLSNAAYLTGDIKSVYGGKVLLRKKAITTLTGSDLKGLANGKISNSRGITAFKQYIRFGSTGFNPITVNYIENDDNDLNYFFVLDEGAPFVEWEIQFSDGLESQRDGNGHLIDLEDNPMSLMGMPASIVDATIDSDGTDLQLKFMSGSIGDTLREGETKIYTINGEDYEVTLAFVSDPNTGNIESKFVVNGEMTDAMQEGDIERVGDTRIGVRDIMVNAREGVASFYIGANDVTFTDPTPTTEDFDGTVEVNDESIEEGTFQAVGNYITANQTYRLAWLKYQLEADAAEGNTIYISDKEHTLREQLDEPEGLFSDLNIHYHGLLPVTRKDVKITADGDDSYKMTFVNVEGKTFTMPLLSNKDGIWRFGDENDDLIFAEGTSLADHNIGINDYILLSNSKTGNDADKSVTSVVRYVDYDATNYFVEFESYSDHNISKVPVSSNGIGYLVFGTSTFKFNVSDVNASQPTLSMDLDADGGFSDETKVVGYGGVIINLAQTIYRNDTLNVTLTDATITDVVGNGKNISGVVGFTAGSGFVQMNALVLAKKFNTPNTDETFNWTISQASSNEVDLSFAATGYDGPFNTDTSNINYGFLLTSPEDDDDHEKAITDWGIMIDVYNPSNDPAELTLNLPQTIQYTQLFVTIGDVRHESPSVVTEKVNPLAVGIAITDSEASAIGSENMIVVGGPCINTVAAELLGNPEEAQRFRTFLTALYHTANDLHHPAAEQIGITAGVITKPTLWKRARKARRKARLPATRSGCPTPD